MKQMFAICKKLKEIKGLNNFNTKNVIDMSGMFQLCNELEYLDLSNFNTRNVSNMSYMFNQCNKMRYLNLNNFIIINCKTNHMFSFENKNECTFITNNENLLKLYSE